VHIAKMIEEDGFDRIAYRAERTVFQTSGVVLFLKCNPARLNCPLRMRCINSIPASVSEAVLKRLKPSMTFVRDLMLRWSCSIRLFRYFEDLTLVSAGSKPSAFISRTARCEAA